MLSDTCREDKENEYTWYLWFKKKDMCETLIITYIA